MRGRRTVTLLAGLCLLAGACGGGSGGGGDTGPEAISVWVMKPGTTRLEEFVSKAVADFEAANPGTHVDVSFVPWTSAHDQFVSAIGGGQVPDLAEMGTTWNAEFASVGALAEITGDLDGYVGSLLEAGTFEGRRYGLPWYAGARAFVYRKDVLDRLGLQPPSTWDELVAVGRAVRDRTDLDAFGVFGKGTHIFLPMVWQAGGEIAVEQDGRWRATIDSPEAVSAIQFYADLFAREKFAPAGALNWTSLDVRSAFLNGDLAMMVAGAWDVDAILAAKPEMAGQIGTALLPAGPGGSRDAFAGGSNLVVFEGSRNKDLARRFADFLVEGERVKEFSAQLGFLPGSAAGLAAVAADEDALHAPFRTQLEEHSRAYPSSPQWGTFEGERLFEAAVQEVMQGRKSAAEAMKGVAERMNAAFAGA